MKIQVNLRLDSDIVERLKTLSLQVHIPYQTLINSFLKQGLDNGFDLYERISKLEKIILKELPPSP